MTTPTEIARIHTLATDARQLRLAGDHHHGTDAEFPLVGYCFDNAYVAWHVLTDAGFDCTVIKGTTERVADDLLQADVDPRELESIVELGGNEHFWVEAADADGQRVVVDIASETWDHLGECLVREALPTEYIMLEDSRAVGEQTFETVREEFPDKNSQASVSTTFSKLFRNKGYLRRVQSDREVRGVRLKYHMDEDGWNELERLGWPADIEPTENTEMRRPLNNQKH